MAIPESGEELVKTLLHGGEDPNEFVKILIQDRVGSHLMEKIIKHSSPTQFRYLYKTFFQSRLLQLCQHPVANFVVQKVIENCHKEKQFKEILDTLSSQFEDFICKFY